MFSNAMSLVPDINALLLTDVPLRIPILLPISLAIISVSAQFRFLKTFQINNKRDMISMGSRCGDLHLSVACSAR